MTEQLERAKRGVLKVGDGRGFVVGNDDFRYVITAAHCLPWFPPCHAASYLEQRTYRDLLGPLGGLCAVWAACGFVDPIADIAVLVSPDDQELADQADAYEALTGTLPPFTVVDIAAGDANGARTWLLSLTGEWNPCRVQHYGGGLCLTEANAGIAGGMSGSPVILDTGAAIGVVCLSSGSGGDIDAYTEGGPNPRLSCHLPGWVLHDIGMAPDGGQTGWLAWARSDDQT
jgi:hypothetical protein